MRRIYHWHRTAECMVQMLQRRFRLLRQFLAFLPECLGDSKRFQNLPLKKKVGDWEDFQENGGWGAQDARDGLDSWQGLDGRHVTRLPGKEEMEGVWWNRGLWTKTNCTVQARIVKVKTLNRLELFIYFFLTIQTFTYFWVVLEHLVWAMKQSTSTLRQYLIENTPKDHAGRRYGLDEFAGRWMSGWIMNYRERLFRKLFMRKLQSQTFVRGRVEGSTMATVSLLLPCVKRVLSLSIVLDFHHLLLIWSSVASEDPQKDRRWWVAHGCTVQMFLSGFFGPVARGPLFVLKGSQKTDHIDMKCRSLAAGPLHPMDGGAFPGGDLENTGKAWKKTEAWEFFLRSVGVFESWFAGMLVVVRKFVSPFWWCSDAAPLADPFFTILHITSTKSNKDKTSKPWCKNGMQRPSKVMGFASRNGVEAKRFWRGSSTPFYFCVSEVNFRKVILRMEMKVVVATKHLELQQSEGFWDGFFLGIDMVYTDIRMMTPNMLEAMRKWRRGTVCGWTFSGQRICSEYCHRLSKSVSLSEHLHETTRSSF